MPATCCSVDTVGKVVWGLTLYLHLFHPSVHPYSFFWTLASLMRLLHSSPSAAYFLQPRIPRICNTSPCTTSSHLRLGFPSDLVLWNFALWIFFEWGGSFLFYILMMCPTHHSVQILISPPPVGEVNVWSWTPAPSCAFMACTRTAYFYQGRSVTTQHSIILHGVSWSGINFSDKITF